MLRGGVSFCAIDTSLPDASNGLSRPWELRRIVPPKACWEGRTAILFERIDVGLTFGDD